MLNFTLGVTSPQGRQLVAPFSLSINENDKIGIIGEEGNGKSLFLKTLQNDQTINELIIERHVSHTKTVFGYIAQDIPVSELEKSALDFLIEDDWERYQTLNQALSIHLSHFRDQDLERPIASFSGGERVKLQLIRVMIQDVDIYILDEPTNDLDLETILGLEDWMMRQTKPVLFVTHDTRLLKNCANRIIHFEQTHRKTRSKISVFEGGYDDYVRTRSDLIRHHNQTVDNQRAEKEKQMDRWRTLYEKVNHRLRTNTRQNPAKGRLLKKKMKTVKAMGRRFEREEISDKIEMEDAISIRFDNTQSAHRKKLIAIEIPKLFNGNKELASQINLDVYSTDKIAIIGRNGSGKTTFLHHAFSNVTAFMHQDYRQNIAYDKTPIENCIMDESREERGIITNRLGSLKFTESEMNTPMRFLSGGQKAKVSLLKLVLLNPSIIVLDEPTRNLSPLSVPEIYQMLRDYQGAIVCVTHDRALIDEVFDSVYEFTSEGLKELKE